MVRVHPHNGFCTETLQRCNFEIVLFCKCIQNKNDTGGDLMRNEEVILIETHRTR